VHARGEVHDDVAQIGITSEARGQRELGGVGGGEQRGASAEAEARDADRRAARAEEPQRRADLDDLASAQPERREAFELRDEHEQAVPGEQPGEADELGVAATRAGESVDEEQRGAWHGRPVEIGGQGAALDLHQDLVELHRIEKGCEQPFCARQRQVQRQAQGRSDPSEPRGTEQRRDDRHACQPG